MRYIDLSLIDENDPDVKAWLQKAQRCLLELSQQETHAQRTKINRISTKKPFNEQDCLDRAKQFNMYEKFKEYVSLYENL